MCFPALSAAKVEKWLWHSLLLFSFDLFTAQTFHFFNAGFTSYWLNQGQRDLAALHLCECAEPQPVDRYHHFMIITYTICRTLVIPGSTRLHFFFFCLCFLSVPAYLPFVHHSASVFSLSLSPVFILSVSY